MKIGICKDCNSVLFYSSLEGQKKAKRAILPICPQGGCLLEDQVLWVDYNKVFNVKWSNGNAIMTLKSKYAKGVVKKPEVKK